MEADRTAVLLTGIQIKGENAPLNKFMHTKWVVHGTQLATVLFILASLLQCSVSTTVTLILMSMLLVIVSLLQ